MSNPRKCPVCGGDLPPDKIDNAPCSPRCRTFAIMSRMANAKASEEEQRRKQLEELTTIPPMDLKSNPMARAEWFMELPKEFRPKFIKFLTKAEQEKVREIAKKQLQDERYYLGYFVKKDKIIEVKQRSEEDVEDTTPDVLDNDGTEDDF